MHGLLAKASPTSAHERSRVAHALNEQVALKNFPLLVTMTGPGRRSQDSVFSSSNVDL